MSRLVPAILLGLCCVGACEGAKPPASKKTDTAEPATRKPAPSETASKPEPPLFSEAEGPPPAERARPAWFDSAKIQHHAVIQQVASNGTLTGGQAHAMILELEPGVSSEQCIERAKAALGESVPELPGATADGDRLMLQGKTDDYEYTVVCGEAKGKPTMYLSYTAQR